MTAVISFRQVSTGDLFEGFSFEIETGTSALMVTSGEVEGSALLRLITGLDMPLRGSVQIFGQNVGDRAADQLCQMRQQIGVIPANGGMISNLKLWENITLPLLFTTGQIPPETEDYVINCSKKLGIAFNFNALPANLSPHARRVAAFIRASLCQPRIMVYNYCFENLSVAARNSFCAAASEFHSAAPGRTSLYLVSSADMARNLPADVIIKVHDTVEPATVSA